jgi:hypothetical protein
MLHHLTMSMTQAGDVSTARTANVRVQGALNFQVLAYYNDITCGATTPVCQGIESFQPYVIAYNNYCHFPTNTSGTDTPRCFVLDENESDRFTEVGRSVIANNLMDVANNRGVRIKSQHGVYVHDNRFDNISNDGTVGAIHVADLDSSDNLAMDALIENNTFRVSTGNAIMARGGSGIVAQTNTVTCISSCTGGRFFDLRTSSVGSVSQAYIRNNPTVSGVGFTSENIVEASSTAFNCNSGAWTGAGTSTALTGC